MGETSWQSTSGVKQNAFQSRWFLNTSSEWTCRFEVYGGEGGIRTPDTLSGMAAFEAARFNRSRTSPRRIVGLERPFTFYQREYLDRLVPDPFRAKEVAQNLRTSLAQHSSRDFHLMIELRMVQNIHHRIDSARFRIRCAVDQPFQTGVYHRASAHRARLNDHVNLAALEPMVSELCSGGSQSDDLGVR